MKISQGWMIPQGMIEKALMPNKKLIPRRPWGLCGNYVFTVKAGYYVGQLSIFKSYCVIADYWLTKLWMKPVRAYLKCRAIRTFKKFKER